MLLITVTSKDVTVVKYIVKYMLLFTTVVNSLTSRWHKYRTIHEINVNAKGGEVHSSATHVSCILHSFWYPVFPLWSALVQYIAQTKEQPELWLEHTENLEITSNATAVRKLSEEINNFKKHVIKSMWEKQDSFRVIGFERLQMSKDWATHYLKELIIIIQVRQIQKVQWHYCHGGSDMLSKTVIV